MSSGQELLSNNFSTLVDEVSKIGDSIQVMKNVSKNAKRKNRRRRRRRNRQSDTNSKEGRLCPISLDDCKGGSKRNSNGSVVSPTTIRESSNIAIKDGLGMPKVEVQASSGGNNMPKELEKIGKLPRTQNIARKRGKGRKGRPEFERPVSWLAENISRWILGDTVLNNTQLFYSHFVTYNEMLKPQCKKERSREKRE